MIYTRKKEENEDYKNCQFCKIKGSIIENSNWFVVGNRAPYDFDLALQKKSRHILLIPKHHITNLLELTKTTVKGMMELQEKILKAYKELYNSCFMFIRQNTANQSMFHLHWQIIDQDDFVKTGVPENRYLLDYDPIDIELKNKLRELSK